jgi:deaminated glutathione amidase
MPPLSQNQHQDKVRVAVIQTTAGPDMAANLAALRPLLEEAAEKGATFMALPENSGVMIKDRKKMHEAALPEENHPALQFFSDMAVQTKCWIMSGSLAIREENGKLANRCYLLDDKGTVRAAYSKIHLFDADLGGGETYHESAIFNAGREAILATTPWGPLGLTICYDVRFPHLFRQLAMAGAKMICVPAAFAVTSGKWHWHTLLRARAIENRCYIVAPAQCGTHDGNRQTYGHSLIVDPNGVIVAEAGDAPCLLIADLDMDNVKSARQSIPSLDHHRDFLLREI